MTKIILEKTSYFDNIYIIDISTKRKLEGIFSKDFENMDKLKEEFKKRKLPLNVYMPAERSIKIDTLPFTIKEWPLYYNKWPTPYGVYEIAKIKVIE